MQNLHSEDSVQQDMIVGGGQYQDASNPSALNYVFSTVDLHSRQHSLISMDFLPHGIALNPKQTEQLLVCEKIGPGAALIDIKSSRVLETVTTDPARLFYGHCAFSKDGKLIYTTETYRDSLKGTIVVRELESQTVIGEFPSYGQSPHECFLIDDGKVMVVTNGGGDLAGDKPNVSYIDIETQQLIRQEHFTNRHINAGHLMLSDADVIAACTLIVGLIFVTRVCWCLTSLSGSGVKLKSIMII